MVPSQTPKLVKLSVQGLPDVGAGAPMKALLEDISKALSAWMPRLSFSVKLPCPACCPDDALGKRLLDLNELIAEEMPVCPATKSMLSAQLPSFVTELRERHGQASATQTGNASGSAVESSE